MANPTCEIKNGGAAYVPTTNGVNVTPAATVVIRLVSSADVDSWAITCITADDITSVASINASLVINSVLKTATFTAPAAGRALRFQSTVNGGIDRNGVAQPSYATTLMLYTLIGGLRVHALDEALDGNPLTGWGADLNALIRNPASATNTLQGDGSGYAQITALSGTVTTTPKGTDTDYELATTTPNATAATIYSYPTTTGRIISIDGIITLFNGGSGYAKYKIDGLYTNVGGTLAKWSTTPGDVATGPESSATCDVILTLSGTNIIVQGKGFSSNNSWTGRIFVHEAAF